MSEASGGAGRRSPQPAGGTNRGRTRAAAAALRAASSSSVSTARVPNSSERSNGTPITALLTHTP